MITFNAVIGKNEEKFAILLIQLGDLGSHSTKKGYESMVSDGCTLPHPMAQNFL